MFKFQEARKLKWNINIVILHSKTTISCFRSEGGGFNIEF